ncbi:MAG: hypothetical protein JSS20_21440, partial [Proteobacteria bacterium]|nr:hypothetical protein [Pseudomonadota bacterium]
MSMHGLRFLVFAFLGSWLFGPLGGAAAQTLTETVDASTGIRVDLPLAVLTRKSPTRRGTNWQSPDKRLDVDLLSLGRERSLAQLHATLRGVAKRRITTNSVEPQSFLLEGVDGDGRRFLVTARERNGEVRALSITYDDEAGAALARSIASSFKPFPNAVQAGQNASLSAASPRLPAPATCQLPGRAGARSGPTASVAVTTAGGLVRTGDPIAIDWRVDDLDIACRDPLYLVFSIPMRARFEGDHLLALTPGAAAPFAIKHRRERTRVLVPLHLGTSARHGTFAVRVFETGPLVLDWALVEVPRLVAEPRSKADLSIGREQATQPVPLGERLAIVGGNPRIVVRDQFSTDQPAR